MDEGSLYPCPCCGRATLLEPNRWEICTECGWEDEPEDDPEEQRCGPNHMTLAEAQENYERMGAIDEHWVGVKARRKAV